jgi:hypothetical protein
VYAGKDGKKRRTLLSEPQDVIVLLHDNWDDYTYKTTFPTDCRMNGEDVEIGTIQILVEGQKTTFAYLDNLVENGWDGVFPIPDTHYISVPSGLTFYEQIEGHLGLAEAVDAAQRLHDASYLTKIQEDDDALRLMNSERRIPQVAAARARRDQGLPGRLEDLRPARHHDRQPDVHVPQRVGRARLDRPAL